MIENQEMPIGFTMELSKHLDVLNQFSSLSDVDQHSIIEGARQVKSREEMRNYVENMF